MNGPREELLTTGQLGPMGVELLYETVRQVIRMRNLPPPPGLAIWTHDALVEAAHDIFVSRGPERLLLLAARSSDEPSFRAQLWKTVVNDLASTGRKTETGRLSERLKDVLPSIPGVVRGDGVIRLHSVDESLPEPRFDELVTAAALVAVTVPTWDPNSGRRPPLADRASLVDMIKAILSLAPRGLAHSGLVEVVAVRLGVHDAPELVDETALDAYASHASENPESIAVDRDAGERLLDNLSTAEQMVLPYLGESVTVIAEGSGLKRTKAHQTARSVRLKLVDLLADDPSPEATLREARSQARTRWGLR